ncbi:MarR family winged helix-turn-helix transcriptional regulator [Thiomonas sp.]|jgi:DNA-binding MarR family transcriptional regulator|uniref:MarR family winged helix-turn-helix transcriptional regulator n=1 Tax=Thiomonas sp. TaxID=2047785 RepID=UPI00260FADA3|nr:MarR family transcriptional regulator [Thiomonas sp.]
MSTESNASHSSARRATAASGLDQAVLGHVLGYQLARASIHTRAAFQRAIGEPLRLRPVEFTILQLLRHNRRATQKQLARALAITAPGMTVLLDRLESRGLIRRERNEHDKRSVFVTLDETGEDLAEASLRASRDMETEVLHGLSAGERLMLFELLDRVARGPR